MTQRILALTNYLLYRLTTSLTGLGYLVMAMVYYGFAFRTRTPEPDYFVLVIGLFGALITFLTGLTLAAKANEAQSDPILVRLPSRVEYLAAVLTASLVYGLGLQLLMAFLAYFRNEPALTLGRALEIPPIWLSLNIFAAVVALHASDFVAAGWSRVAIFGSAALFLMGSDGLQSMTNWLAEQASQASNWAYGQGSATNGQFFQDVAGWLRESGGSSLQWLFDAPFWPFQATFEAVVAGQFSRTQALAPAAILLYATILFLLAAEFFAHKDIHLVEE